jgi:hypothetical protein
VGVWGDGGQRGAAHVHRGDPLSGGRKLSPMVHEDRFTPQQCCTMLVRRCNGCSGCWFGQRPGRAGKRSAGDKYGVSSTIAAGTTNPLSLAAFRGQAWAGQPRADAPSQRTERGATSGGQDFALGLSRLTTSTDQLGSIQLRKHGELLMCSRRIRVSM